MTETVVSRLHAAVSKPAPRLLETRVVLQLSDAIVLLDEIRAACPRCGSCSCGTAVCDLPQHMISDAIQCAGSSFDLHCSLDPCALACPDCADALEHAVDRGIS